MPHFVIFVHYSFMYTTLLFCTYQRKKSCSMGQILRVHICQISAT